MNLNIETGLQEFDLNGKVKVYYNPADVNFVRKLYEAFGTLEKQQKKYEEEVKAVPEEDPDAVFEFADKKDREMREIVDGCFDTEVCGPLFGGMSVYASNAQGIPLWMALFLAVLDSCEETVEKVGKSGSETVDKYMKKYQKYHR